MASLARATVFFPAVVVWTAVGHVVGLGGPEAGGHAPLDRPRRQNVDVPGPAPAAGVAAYEGRLTDDLALLLSDEELVCAQDRGWKGVWRSPVSEVRSITHRDRHRPVWPDPDEPAERLVRLLRRDS